MLQKTVFIMSQGQISIISKVIGPKRIWLLRFLFMIRFCLKTLFVALFVCRILAFVVLFFFTEDNGLPFDSILKRLIKDYAEGKYEILKAKSIFYKDRQDFKSFLSFKCINKRSTLDKPEMEHMSSDEFSFESWKTQNV